MRPDEGSAVEALLRAAFPDEDLVPVVRALLLLPGVDSLVAVDEAAPDDEGVIGHVLFTRCGVAGGAPNLAMLAPLAVAEAHRRRGVATALMRDGFARLAAEGIETVYVLGDPGFYGRIGFRPERSVMPPYPLVPEWRDAWQSRPADEGAPANEPVAGTLDLPAPWHDPALWMP